VKTERVSSSSLEEEQSHDILDIIDRLVDEETLDFSVETSLWVSDFSAVTLLDRIGVCHADAKQLLNDYAKAGTGEKDLVAKCREMIAGSLTLSRRVDGCVSHKARERIAVLNGAALSSLGCILRVQNDPVSSEGLFRNALKCFTEHKEASHGTWSGKATYAELLFNYAQLLSSWEGRQKEADNFLAEHSKIIAELAAKSDSDVRSDEAATIRKYFALRSRFRPPVVTLGRCFFDPSSKPI